MSCPRCGQPLAPNTPTCPRCGAPVSPSAGWSQPMPGDMNASPFGMAAPSAPYNPPPAQGFGAPQQPPRFAVGSLISDGDLPDWLREGVDGQAGAQQAGWGAPPPPAQPSAQPIAPMMGQGWPQQADPRRPDITSEHTVRQPAVAPASPPASPYALGQQQQGYPPQSTPSAFQPGYSQQPGWPPQGYSQPAGYPPQQQGFSQPVGYPPQQQGYPQQGYAPQAYPAPQPGFPPQPGPANYGGYAAHPQTPPPPAPAAPVNAFPAIEQAGMAYQGPQGGGMAGHALLDQQALPNWLAGAAPYGPGPVAARAPVPSGMQARSLIDDQALPKWLRDQPETTASANVSEWIGASAAQEPMPQFLSEAYAQAQVARAPQAPQPYADPFNAPQPMGGLDASNLLYRGPAPSPNAAMRNDAPQPGYGDDTALPDWLRAQAGGAAPAAVGDQQPPVGFAASDLIDPSALPDWVTQRAPAPQAFSSTHGWSAAMPEPEAPYAPSGQDYAANTGDGYGYGDGYGDGFNEGYGGDYDGGYDGAASMQGTSAQSAWGDAGWDDGSAQSDQTSGGRGDSGPQYGRGRPLAAEELPPWLRGKGGQASDAPQPRGSRNPWAAASEPAEFAGGWDDADAWGEQGNQADQGWNDASWGNGRDDRRGERSRGDWGQAEPSEGWDDPRGAGGWDGPERRSRRDADERRGPPPRRNGERDRRGYTDEQPHARRGYDDRYGGPDDEMGYDDEEEPSDGQRGRGWLGFLRRDKH